MASNSLTAHRLREVLDYNPDTGAFTRKGKAAGTVSKVHGYAQIWVDGSLYRAHRLAWLYVHGDWPAGDIDHVNGIKTDNRVANLRDVSRSVNQENQRSAQRNSRSGLLGATWREHAKRWYAQISVKGKVHCLGYFDSAEEAHKAYLAAKRRLHKGCTI